jgi:uncharacterized protein (DUF58 family)
MSTPLKTVNNLPKYFDPRTLAKLQSLTLRARHVVEGYVAGLHRSPSRGFSIEFAEHREYSPGDDLRYVDWKVFGRTDKYYLKQFEDETNLICYLVLDKSESMRYQGPDSPWTKFDHAACAAASLAWLVLQQQDAVGLATFDDEVRDYIRPSNNPSHLKQLLHIMEVSEARQKTATGKVLHDLADRFARRGVVLLFSDLFDNLDELMVGVKHLRHRRHDVIVVHVLDAAELDFPFRRPTLFRGLEQLPELRTDPRGLRPAYLKQIEQFQQKVQARCGELQVDYVRIRNDMPLDLTLSSFLAHRMARLT